MKFRVENIEQVAGKELIGWWLDDSDPNSPETFVLEFSSGKQIDIYVNAENEIVIEGD
jgi:hypothetical protein